MSRTSYFILLNVVAAVLWSGICFIGRYSVVIAVVFIVIAIVWSARMQYVSWKNEGLYSMRRAFSEAIYYLALLWILVGMHPDAPTIIKHRDAYVVSSAGLICGINLLWKAYKLRNKYFSSAFIFLGWALLIITGNYVFKLV